MNPQDKEYQDKIQMPPPPNVPMIVQRNKKIPTPAINTNCFTIPTISEIKSKESNASNCILNYSHWQDIYLSNLLIQGIRRSPGKKRGRMSSSPVSEKRLALSPVSKRKKMSPISRKASVDKSRKHRRGASSSSGSGWFAFSINGLDDIDC